MKNNYLVIEEGKGPKVFSESQEVPSLLDQLNEKKV